MNSSRKPTTFFSCSRLSFCHVSIVGWHVGLFFLLSLLLHSSEITITRRVCLHECVVSQIKHCVPSRPIGWEICLLTTDSSDVVWRNFEGERFVSPWDAIVSLSLLTSHSSWALRPKWENSLCNHVVFIRYTWTEGEKGILCFFLLIAIHHLHLRVVLDLRDARREWWTLPAPMATPYQTKANHHSVPWGQERESLVFWLVSPILLSSCCCCCCSCKETKKVEGPPCCTLWSDRKK